MIIKVTVGEIYEIQMTECYELVTLNDGYLYPLHCVKLISKVFQIKKAQNRWC